LVTQKSPPTGLFNHTSYYGFYSLEDIENFISLLDPKIVTDHFGDKTSKEDLFKD
tara:strand:- start:246 stop:410 length:165 start_codon:yes stop_codon:yes gene_type:complete